MSTGCHRTGIVPTPLARSDRSLFSTAVTLIMNQMRLTQSLLCFIASLLALGALPQVVVADAADDEMRVGYELYKKKRYKNAVDVFKKFLTDYPQNKRVGLANLYLGASLLELEEYAEAKKSFSAFADKNPNDKRYPTALYRIGECNFNLGEYQQAEAVFTDFLKRFPKHNFAVWALSYQGDTFLRVKKYAAAEATYRKLLKEHPQSELIEDTEISLAQTLVRLKKPTEAIQLFSKYPQNETAVYQTASFQLNSGKFSEAAQSYDKVISQFPNSIRQTAANLNSGYCHYRSGSYSVALDRVAKVAPTSKYHARAELVRGLSLDRLNRFDEAGQVFDRAYKKYSDSPIADQLLFNQAVAYYKGERFADSAKLFEMVSTKFSKGRNAAQSRVRAAEAWLNAGERQKARKLVENAKLPASQQMDAQIVLGRILRDSELEDERRRSVEIFRQVTKSSDGPARIEASYYLLKPLRDLNQHAEVLESGKALIDSLESGQERTFDNAYILYGMSALELKKPQLAADAISKYLTRNPRGTDLGVAYANRAIAYGQLGNEPASSKDLQLLQAIPRENQNYIEAVQRIADITWGAAEYEWSGKLFGILADLKPDNEARPAGISGRAWCLFKQKQYEKAETDFGRLTSEYSSHEIAPEAAFMQARCQDLANKKREALLTYQAVFMKYSPKNARAGEEKTGKAAFAFRAGRFLAALMEEMGQADGANSVYSQLVSRYPKAEIADELLNSQAVMNHEAGRYEQSDEAFRKLLKDYPNSPRRFQAMQALADSDLVAGNIDKAKATFQQISKDDSAPADVRAGSQFQLMNIARNNLDWQSVDEISKKFLADYSQSAFARQVRLARAESQFFQQQYSAAAKALAPLRSELMPAANATTSVEWQGWEGRAWIISAEIMLQQKNYDGARQLIDELSRIPSAKPHLHKGYEIVGRSWKQQSPPNFDRAREYFAKAIGDSQGGKTETAAKAQFMIGETWLLQKEFSKAYDAYTRAHVNYKFPQWQAPALYQAGSIEEQEGEYDRALETYQVLVEKHRQDPHAAKAQQRIEYLRQQSRS